MHLLSHLIPITVSPLQEVLWLSPCCWWRNRHREVKSCALGHTARGRESQFLKPDSASNSRSLELDSQPTGLFCSPGSDVTCPLPKREGNYSTHTVDIFSSWGQVLLCWETGRKAGAKTWLFQVWPMIQQQPHHWGACKKYSIQAPPQNWWVRTCLLTRSAGDTHAYWCLRSTKLKSQYVIPGVTFFSATN